MSTPTEKALEIANKMYYGSVFEKTKAEHLQEIIRAKELALFAVDEVITAIENVFTKSVAKLNSTYRYWQEVKQEIEKL
jgi:hypothetical protein